MGQIESNNVVDFHTTILITLNVNGLKTTTKYTYFKIG